MGYAEYSASEIVSRGEFLYAQEIRDRIAPQNQNRFVVIDIESGDYEVADTDVEATKALLVRHANAVLYGLRVGHRAAYSMGGHRLGSEK